MKNSRKREIKNAIDNRPELFKYLNRLEIYGRFVRACVKEDKPINLIVNDILVSDYPIMSVFGWSNTTEDIGFWSNRNVKIRK